MSSWDRNWKSLQTGEDQRLCSFSPLLSAVDRQRTATSSTLDQVCTLGLSGFYIFKRPQAKYMNFIRNISLISHFLLIQNYHDYKKFEMKILVGETWFPERDLSWKRNKRMPFTVSRVPEICKRWCNWKDPIFLCTRKDITGKDSVPLHKGRPFLFTFPQVHSPDFALYPGACLLCHNVRVLPKAHLSNLMEVLLSLQGTH